MSTHLNNTLSKLRELVHSLSTDPEGAHIGHEYVRAHLSPGGEWDAYRAHVDCCTVLWALSKVEAGDLPVRVVAVRENPRFRH